MIQPWPVIVASYRAALREANGDEPFWRAVERVSALATKVADDPLSKTLVGWISMHDLFIQQSDGHPFRTPYLRISPMHTGLIEFRMIDAWLNEGQWRREVSAAETVAQGEGFLAELGWSS